MHGEGGDDREQARREQHVLRPPGRGPVLLASRRFEPQAKRLPRRRQPVALFPGALVRAGEALLEVVPALQRRFHLHRGGGVEGHTPAGPPAQCDIAGDALDLEGVPAGTQDAKAPLPAAQLVQAFALLGQGGFVLRAHRRRASCR